VRVGLLEHKKNSRATRQHHYNYTCNVMSRGAHVNMFSTRDPSCQTVSVLISLIFSMLPSQCSIVTCTVSNV
jgi:hypothetical protein